MHFKVIGAAVAVVGALTLGMAATPASALTLVAGEEDCDLYTTGCLFDLAGNEFDDELAYIAAYNAAHLPEPPPEDLPPDIFELGKLEAGQDFDDELFEVTFTDLPWDVSYYSIKAGSDQVLLFGLSPPSDTFTVSNLRIDHAISHVTFYGGTDGGGGGGNEVPEPATWAMMIMGFGGIGTMMRRRRTAMVPA